MKKLTFGIVGCGNSARNIHYKQLERARDKIEVGACFDLDALKADEICRLYGAKPYSSLKDFLGHPGLDLVLVATKPPSTHAEVGLAALEAGKHVLLEKPMCDSHAEGAALIEKSREKGLVLTVFHNRRGAEWDPDFEAVRWGVSQGYFGKLKLFETLWCGNYLNAEWLFDWGIHLFDQLLAIMKAEPVEVSCSAGPPGKMGTPSGPWAAFVRFDDGSAGIVSMRIGNFGDYPRFTLAGDTGGCSWPARSARVEEPGSGKLLCSVPAVHAGQEKESQEPFETVIEFTPFYENLYEAVTSGAELIVKPEEALAAVDLANAAMESARKEKSVRMRDIIEK